jgi:hypothetical protein
MKSNWTSKMLAIGVLGILIYIPLATGNVASQDNPPMIPSSTDTTSQNPGPPPGGVRMPKNAQVLTGLNLKEINLRMQDIAKDLGVRCNFCHIPRDFPSDEKKEKLTARKMMKMTNDLNHNYFGEEQSPKITCYTCHRGQEKPVSNPAPAVSPPNPPDSRPPLRFDN